MVVQQKRAELEVKFNDLTDRVNIKWSYFNEKYFKSLRKVSVLENERNLFINDRFSYFMDQIVSMGNNIAICKQFKSKDLNSFDFFDEVLSGMPLNWLKQDIKELRFAETMEETNNRQKLNYDDKYINSLFNIVCQYRQQLPRLQSLKIDLYIDTILGFNKKIVKESLKEMIVNKMTDSVYSLYLLNFLNYKIHLVGNQVGVSAESAISLRDTFFTIIKSEPFFKSYP
jgi:hypothetical protein